MSVGAARLREEPDVIRQGAIDKGEDPTVVDRALEVDARRRALSSEGDRQKAERNSASKQIGEAIRAGADPKGPRWPTCAGSRPTPASGSTRSTPRWRSSRPSSRSCSSGSRTRRIRGSRSAAKRPTSWSARGDRCCLVTRARWARRPHWELGEAHHLFDLERGAKVAGSGFPVYRGAGSTLQRALIDFFLDTHTRENGMTEIWPPAVVNAASARGTGQIPDKEDQMYVVTRDDLYLVPTAEVPVTNLHRDEILEAAELPIRYAAYSPCFRREAGAAGKETRGIVRVHQFDKVEMVFFEKPADSEAALDELVGFAETLLQRLGLSYRVLLMATREMGFVQARKYDLEVWAPGVERWLEVSSCSNFRDYQARRMAIRYRPEPGAKPELVHTLNGSGLALARVVAAILETYQREDGSIDVPQVLRSRMGMDRIGG